MTEPMDHETCSQLLRAYLADEAGEHAAAIADHLKGCARCQAELVALQNLLAPIEGLTPGERFGLRAGIDRAIASTPAGTLRAVPPVSTSTTGTTSVPQAASLSTQRSRERSRRMASLLSAAAAILLIATGVVLVQHLGTSSSNSGSHASAARGALQPNEAATTGPGGKFNDSTGLSSLALPRFAPAALHRVQAAETHAASILSNFAAAYNGTQVGRLAPNFLRRLSQAAPQTVSGQVARCGARVLDEHGGATLPAYGALAPVNGQRGLVLVFATPSSPGAPLTRFELHSWPVGSCDLELLHRSGPIRR
jgi:hypothetical protein